MIFNNHKIHPDFDELREWVEEVQRQDFRIDWCDARDQKGHEEAQRYASPDDFFRDTLVFCYQNIGLLGQGIHRPYLANLLAQSADKGRLTVLDYGAGGGAIGLALHALGYQVSFADVAGKSLAFLRWRLKRRGLRLPVYNLSLPEDTERIPWHDAVVCFDVIEHLRPKQQRELLTRLGQIGGVSFVNLIRGDGTELDGLHFEVNAEELTDYISLKYPCVWKDYYPDAAGVFRQRLLMFGMSVRLE